VGLTRVRVVSLWTLACSSSSRGLSNITQAKKARRNLLADLEAKRAVPSSKRTVSNLADQWLKTRLGRVRDRTYETDERYVALVKRHFGGGRVQDVNPRDIECFLTALRNGKVGRSERPLAERTVGNALKTLHAVLNMPYWTAAWPSTRATACSPT